METGEKESTRKPKASKSKASKSKASQPNTKAPVKAKAPKAAKADKAAQPVKKTSIKTSYETIRKEVEKPTAQRSQVETRRGNSRIPRRYHLTKTKMEKLLERTQTTGGFPNPYRRGGIYHALVQSLTELGENQKHSFKTVLKQVEKVLRQYTTKDKKNAWEVFSGRTPRNELSGKDVPGRVLQDAMVLQRLTGFHPYGEKLRQLCACIDIFKENDLPVLQLNTMAATPADVSPINEMRSVRGRAKADKTAVKSPKKKTDQKAQVKVDTGPVTGTPVEPVTVVEVPAESVMETVEVPAESVEAPNPAKIEPMPEDTPSPVVSD